MKKTIAGLMALWCLVGMLTGCRSAGPAVATDPANQTAGSETSNPPEHTEAAQDAQATETGTLLPDDGDVAIDMGNNGRMKIAYTGNRSGVRYVTDPSQLPDYPELAKYDEAYFRNRGLLLVTETVNSGSVRVSIESVIVENGVANVTLKRDIPAGMHTADMTTWLLWLEVDAGLELDWVLVNPAMKPDTDQNQAY